MTQPKDKSVDDLYKKVGLTRERLIQADEYIRGLGEGAQKIGLSIDGAMLEMNVLLKDLFICVQNHLPEYEMLQGQLMEHLNNIHTIVSTQFGKLKREELKVKESH